jgi:hypothetical protein
MVRTTTILGVLLKTTTHTLCAARSRPHAAKHGAAEHICGCCPLHVHQHGGDDVHCAQTCVQASGLHITGVPE